MKKIISILLAVVLCLSVCVGSVISANESEQEYSYYGRILGLGDSWLCGVGASPKVVVPVKAAETLGWEYGSLAGAAGGWYTANVVNAINPEKENNVYDEMVDADTIVIHTGTNDFCGTSHYTTSVKNGTKTFKQLYDALETSYMTRINSIISSIKTANPDALVLLSNMWCSHTNGYTDRLAELEAEGLTDDEIDAIYEDTRNYYRVLAQKSANEKLAAVADSEENVVLFDVDTLMGYGEEKGSSTYVSSNRHPNTAGYNLMADEVVKLIREYYGEENPTFAHPVTTPSEVTTATTTTTTTTT
ncbi:MAG: SGNH/GDSL hydrolase family protein, partial [Clostridia bacterium]|nr:SGNH/GDSL hydrolase family protein [Clostridia bacterium]